MRVLSAVLASALLTAVCALAAALCPRAAGAAAGPFPPPPAPSEWHAGPEASRAAPRLTRDDAVRAPSGAESLRLEFAAPGPDSPGDAGLACIVRGVRVHPHIQTDLSGARGLEFSLRAQEPLAARLTMQSTNVETRVGTDRFLGSFVAGRDWKTLRVAFRHMVPDPTWKAAAAGASLVAGDRVLRPDNVEEIRICVEAGRIDAGRLESGAGALWIGDIRFFK